MTRTASRSASSNARRKPARKATRRVTTERLVWRHATCRIRHTRDYINAGWSMIELMIAAPKGAPLPITATGYLSHFLDEDELARTGGPAAYFAAWLDREAKSKASAMAEFKWRQGDLFEGGG